MSKQTILVSIIIAIVIIAVIVSFCFSSFSRGHGEGVGDMAQISINNQTLKVYVANTDEERKQGLSGITLDEFDADGMLFVFDDSKERVFWMKDMQFPLDIIWIADNKIVMIEKNIEIFDESGLVRRMYSEPFEVNMVLEIPSGGVIEHGIFVGDWLKK